MQRCGIVIRTRIRHFAQRKFLLNGIIYYLKISAPEEEFSEMMCFSGSLKSSENHSLNPAITQLSLWQVFSQWFYFSWRWLFLVLLYYCCFKSNADTAALLRTAGLCMYVEWLLSHLEQLCLQVQFINTRFLECCGPNIYLQVVSL